MTSRDFQDRLARRARRAGVSVPSALGTRLETYYRLLATWNQKINLTGMDLPSRRRRRWTACWSSRSLRRSMRRLGPRG